MKTKTIGTILLATTLTFAGISYAVAGNHHGNRGNNNCKPGMNNNMIFQQLDLTDNQKQEMKAIMASSKGKHKNRATDAERATHRSEMQALIHNETFDEEKAKILISKKQAKHSERKLAKLKAKHQMYQLLTDEQKVQYSELKMQQRGKMKHHHN